MIETELREVIEKAAGERVVLEHPANSEHGDYSTNIALVLAKKLNKDPREVAEEILSKVKSQKSKVFDSVQVAGPGFINFFLSQNYLMGEMGEVQKKKEKYGTSVSSKGKKVMVEFTDPNPFKEFHIGHLYSNIVGESLSRVF